MCSSDLVAQAQEELSRAGERYYSFVDELDATATHLADSTAVKSALRRGGGGGSKILYQVLYRNTQELRSYASFGIYGSEGDCLYSTDGRFPAGTYLSYTLKDFCKDTHSLQKINISLFFFAYFKIISSTNRLLCPSGDI